MGRGSRARDWGPKVLRTDPSLPLGVDEKLTKERRAYGDGGFSG